MHYLYIRSLISDYDTVSCDMLLVMLHSSYKIVSRVFAAAQHYITLAL
jgi:hypothetical protein